MILTIVGLLLIAISVFYKTFSDVHKFQQYGYYTNQYLNAIFKSKNKWVKPYESFYLIGVLILFLVPHDFVRILSLLLLVLNLYFYRLIQRAYPAKKK